MARIKYGKGRLVFPSSTEYGIWDISVVGDFNTNDYYGFVYEIVNCTNNKRYIGSKSFTEGCGSGVRRSSNWKKYTSSSVSLNKDLNKGNTASFTILSLHKSKQENFEEEIRLQYDLNVLHTKDKNGNKIYYNGVIAGKDFVNINTEPFSKERRHNIGANRDYASEVWGTEAQKRASEKNKQRTWWNDGVKSYFLLSDVDKSGLVEGRITSLNTHVCLCCKEQFSSAGKTKMFCSKYCLNHFYREITRIKKSGRVCTESKNYLQKKKSIKSIKMSFKKTKPRERSERAGIKENLCRWCGGIIQRSSGRLFYCSEDCRLKFKRKSTAERVNKIPEPMRCSLCGGIFTTIRHDQHLCSKKCRDIYKNKVRFLRGKSFESLLDYAIQKGYDHSNFKGSKEDLEEFLLLHNIRIWKKKIEESLAK